MQRDPDSAATTRPLVAASWLALLASVAASTVVHHGRPQWLGVPPTDGVPLATPGTMLALDLVPLGLAGMCLVHAWRRLGPFLATTFLAGSFVFTGVEETMWILLGRFGPDGTYYFTRGFFWFLETPVSACVGWFVLAYACMHAAEIVFPRLGVVARATIAGLLAMNLDLWVDPVQTHPALLSWIWADQPGGIWIFSIPITNFIGWFLLIFLFALVFERLPAAVAALGPARATLRFYGILLALEVGILAFFTVYGALEQTLIRPKLNLTVWGI